MTRRFCDGCGIEIGPEDQLPWTDHVDGRYRVLVAGAVKISGDWKEADLCIVCVRHILDANIQNRRLAKQEEEKQKEPGSEGEPGSWRETF